MARIEFSGQLSRIIREVPPGFSSEKELSDRFNSLEYYQRLELAAFQDEVAEVGAEAEVPESVKDLVHPGTKEIFFPKSIAQIATEFAIPQKDWPLLISTDSGVEYAELPEEMVAD